MSGAARLTGLPTELLLMISSHLQASSLISLKLTSRRLYQRVPTPTPEYCKTAPECEKKAIRRYLRERAEALGGRRRCVVCNGLQPLARFQHAHAPVCKWHDGWFMKTEPPVWLEPILASGFFQIMQQDKPARWIAIERRMCVHCKDTPQWDVRGCNCPDGGCDSCGSVDVCCYVRVSNGCGVPQFKTLHEAEEESAYVEEEDWICVAGQPLLSFSARVQVVKFEDALNS